MGDNIGFFETHPDYIDFLVDELGSPIAFFDDPTAYYAPIHTYIHPITLQCVADCHDDPSGRYVNPDLPDVSVTAAASR